MAIERAGVGSTCQCIRRLCTMEKLINEAAPMVTAPARLALTRLTTGPRPKPFSTTLATSSSRCRTPEHAAFWLTSSGTASASMAAAATALEMKTVHPEGGGENLRPF